MSQEQGTPVAVDANFWTRAVHRHYLEKRMHRTKTEKTLRIQTLFENGYTVQQIEYITRYDRSDINQAIGWMPGQHVSGRVG